MIVLWLAFHVAWAIDAAGLETAVSAELQRALHGLELPHQPTPHHISAQILDGHYVTIFTQDGALVSEDAGPHREARVDVRVGTPTMDSANFSASFGNRDGTQIRGLHHEDVEIATRRELWLALDHAYKGATETYASKKAARGEQGREFPPDWAAAPPLSMPYTPAPKPNRDTLTERVRGITEAVGTIQHLETSAFLGHEWQGKRLLITTEGTRAWLPTGRVVVRGEVIGRATDGARLRNTRSWVARSAESLPDTESMRNEMIAAATWIQTLQDAPVEKDYLGPVLFEEAAANELFRQLLHPEISGSPPPESAPDPMTEDTVPVPHARIGRRLRPSKWNVIDDASQRTDHASHYTHDHQGVAVQPVHVVEDGILREVLMSRTPRQDKTESTGHARTTGGDRRTAMPSQVTVTPPKGLPDTRLRKLAISAAKSAGLPYVVVIRRITPPSLSEDFEFAVTGDGPLSGLTPPEEAYRLYASGKVEPIRGLQFSGVDRRVLRDIIASGKTNRPTEMLDGSGTSERFTLGEAGGVPVSWSTPAVLISEMELRGHAGGEARVIPKPNGDLR